MEPFPPILKNLITTTTWTYAKTMPQWPHEYIVRNKGNENLFVQFVKHIREFGYLGTFYQKRLIYFEEDGLVFWTMGAPIEETIIINRCKKESTYEARLKNGTLPSRN